MAGALSIHGGELVAVDCHAHVLRRDAPLAPERHSAPKRDCTVEEYLAVLDAHGISHGVLTAPSFYATDNSLLLDALDRAAGRLRGTVIVAPDVERAALEAMGERGAVGIRLNWFRRASLPDAASADYRRLFAIVRDLGWHVEIRAFARAERMWSSTISAAPIPRAAPHAPVSSACSKACAPAIPGSNSPRRIGRAVSTVKAMSTRCSAQADRGSLSGRAIGHSCRTKIM